MSVSRVSLPSQKTGFPVDWRLLVKGRIANIGILLDFSGFCCFNDFLRLKKTKTRHMKQDTRSFCLFLFVMVLVLLSANVKGFSVSRMRDFLGELLEQSL